MNTIVLAAMEEELACVAKNAGVRVRCCGVGKVNAALAVTACMSPGARHETIIVIGTSGAADPRLEVGDVVIATDTLFHDVDVTALGFAPGQIPFAEKWRWESDLSLIGLAHTAVRQANGRVTFGRVVTGDRFVSDPSDVAHIYETFGASAIDMETAAVAMAVERSPEFQHGATRWCSIRIISDRADKSAAADFPAFLPRTAETIGRIVEEIVMLIC